MSLSNEAGRARGEGPQAAGSIRAAVIASVIDLHPLSRHQLEPLIQLSEAKSDRYTPPSPTSSLID